MEQEPTIHKKTNLSLYAQYLSEFGHKGIVENEYGFATFEYPTEDVVYIVDLFIKPEHRKSHAASFLADTICEEALKLGRTTLLGSVDANSPCAERSIKVLNAYGMKVCKIAEPMIFFSKSIKPKDTK